MQVIKVECIGITVADMERSLQFYTTILAFKKVSDVAVSGKDYERLLGLSDLQMRVVRLQLGDEIIELTEYLSPKGRPMPADSHSHDQWFQHLAIVVSNIDQAYQQLCKYDVQQVSTAPQTIPQSNPAAGGVKPFYFKDPDGHSLELIDFPPDKGDSKWQRSTNQLFLGIDHTALVVFQTNASLKFYRDYLGLNLKAQSKNAGIEQENLSGVQDAKVRVSSLKPPTGVGIELLEYVSPGDGRSRPADTRANDLWFWQITLVVPDLAAVVQQLQSANPSILSHLPFDSTSDITPGITSDSPNRSEPTSNCNQGLLIQDPNGHAIRLVTPSATFNPATPQ